MRRMRTIGALSAALIGLGLAAQPAAQATINYFDTTKTVTGAGTVSCPAGYKLTGGGFELPTTTYLPGGTNTQLRRIYDTGRMSHPTANGWTADGYEREDRQYLIDVNEPDLGYGNFSLGTWHAYKPKVYAICVK